MKLSEMVGNESLIALLKRAALPPTTLFSGPEGVGKKTLAIRLAARDVCARPDADGACGTCPSCIKIQSRQHPDVTIVDRDWLERLAKAEKRNFNPQVIPIAVSRELVKEAQYRPYESKRRFFILDEAEKLNESAANALLKTLEEPAETIRFILVTAYPEQLLDTIRSRCQQFLFQPLSRRQLEAHLRRLGEEEAELKAAFAGGSVGRALNLDLEQQRHDRGALGGLLGQWLKSKSFAKLFRALESPQFGSDLRNRERVLGLLELLRSLVHDLYFLQIGQEDRVVNFDQMDALREMSGHCSLDWLRRFLYTIDEAQQDVQQYVHPLMTFEAVWLKSLDDAGYRAGSV